MMTAVTADDHSAALYVSANDSDGGGGEDGVTNASTGLLSVSTSSAPGLKAPAHMDVVPDVLWTLVFGGMIGCAIAGNLAVLWIVLGEYICTSDLARIIFSTIIWAIQLCSPKSYYFQANSLLDSPLERSG